MLMLIHAQNIKATSEIARIATGKPTVTLEFSLTFSITYLKSTGM